ncbi:MAG TPA: peptidoglycan-binding domain-containing protein, partial [Stellaceae bacterium]|nr:peptidoglycan-binding domain-containing protein [Stellaceae bacterium]
TFMKHLAVATLALSGLILLYAHPASAQGCGDGPLSTSAGNLIGSAVGGAAGGLLGNQFGHGSGKSAMTGVGVVGGALAGGYVGRSMEGCGNASQRAAASSQNRAPRRPAAAPARAPSEARTCRFVATQAVIDGREQPIEGVACLEPDGSWKTASGAAAQHAAEADLVLRAQQQLHNQGFYVRNNIDGQWGPATSTAVRNFQRANGLATSGQLDPPTRTALGLDAAPLAGEPATQQAAAPADAPPAAQPVKETR